MSDEELRIEAREAAQQCTMQPGLEYDAILAALRRVRDAATAAERQRCAAVVRNGNWYCDCSDEAGFALGEAAAAIERQEGE